MLIVEHGDPGTDSHLGSVAEEDVFLDLVGFKLQVSDE